MGASKPSPYSVYRDYLGQGRLAYQFSPATGRAVFFPRVASPRDGLTDLEWRVSKGLGTVYSTTVVHPREGEPYNVALIDCDEGFRLMSRVERVPADAVRIGMRVAFTAHAAAGDGDPYPVFVPVDEA